MTPGFRWHPQARLIGPDGNGDGATAQMLRAILGRGRPFRIGLPDDPAPDGGAGAGPVFETLTSGSTGRPRRILRTQASWIASFQVNAALFGIGPGCQVAVLGDLVHSLSLYGVLEGLHLGATVHLLAGVRPDRQAAALAARGIDVLYATPAQLRAASPGDLPDLRLILVGGSKLDDRLRAELASSAPAAEVREFYGAAEASFITLANAGTPPDSVGRAYPGWKSSCARARSG
ncbi:MAG: AMP-binding protein [Paracoccaceae bacterium]